MATHTLLVTFGTSAQSATCAIPCESWEIALQEAAKVFGGEHYAPVYEVAIRAGDHAPHLSNSKWVWP